MTTAAVRPDAWNLPLVVHVGGAMLLVGALVVAFVAALAARRTGDGAAALTHLAFRVLLLAALPSYVLMRVGAEWILSAEGIGGEAAWIGIGYSTADGGLLLLIVATVLAWRATCRGASAGRGRNTGVAALSGLLLLAYVVTIWAMTVKPG